MFRTVPMCRLNAVVLERDERRILCELGRLSNVQLVAAHAGEKHVARPFGEPSGELARCNQLASRTEDFRRTLKLANRAREPGPAVPNLDQAESELAAMEERCRVLARRREALEHDAREIESVCVRLKQFCELPLSPDTIACFDFLHCVTGTLPDRPIDLQPLRDLGLVLPLASTAGRRPVLVLTLRSQIDAVNKALHSLDFEPTTLPKGNFTPTQLLAAATKRCNLLDAELEAANREWESLAAEVVMTLAAVDESVSRERSLISAQRLFAHTESTGLLTGWVPAADVPTFVSRLRECTEGRCVIEVSPAENFAEEEIPVLLRSSRMLRPFEKLLSAYGLPKYHELAPTLFVAISFTVMFGMMFGDVGHGSLLMLAGTALLLRRELTRFRDLGVLLLFNGFSSVCFGAIYGSFFGIPGFKAFALWRDPIEGDPANLMLLAISWGLALMSLGLVLNILNQLHRGNFANALLDRFGLAGLVFLWGAVLLIARSAQIRAQGWRTAALLLFIGLPLLCWAAKEPLTIVWSRLKGAEKARHDFPTTITASIVEAFEGGLLYLANTVSFVRLAAYAMSHAALLTATFSLAVAVEHFRFGGAALSLAVIIAGNLLAMVLEGIVAAVQALRLEYYEFFGKFFSGEGQPFKPFCLAARTN